jgi:2-polyprenyl-3-methyl-5-hydroxy-6-metoxy-1,4-benzoquinol methylase
MLRYLPLIVFIGFVACKPHAEDRRADHRAGDDSEQSHGFDELSSDYYVTQDRVIWQKPELVLSLMGNLKGKTVADIGAGTGFFSFRIASRGAKVLAIDIDPRAIEWIDAEKSHYPVEVQALLETRLARPQDPNLRDAEADVVLLVNTYIYIQDRVTYFRNLRSGLQPAAEVIIIDFKDESTPIGPRPEERLPMSTVQKELMQAGYAIIATDSTSLEYQYILKASL